PTRPHKAGHIEGARSVPFSTVTTADLKLAPEAEIAERFKHAGVKAGDTVIVYCHVGQQATATLLAARSLGIEARLYDGSFEEWSRLDGAGAKEPLRSCPSPCPWPSSGPARPCRSSASGWR